MPMFAEILFISKKQRSFASHPKGATCLDSGFSRRALFKMRNHILAMNLCSQLCKRRKMSKDHQWHRGIVGVCLASSGICFGWKETAARSTSPVASNQRPLHLFHAPLHCDMCQEADNQALEKISDK